MSKGTSAATFSLRSNKFFHRYQPNCGEKKRPIS